MSQGKLFEDGEHDWQKEWNGMPEFIQENLEPVSSVVVHFADIEAMKEFSKMVGKNITFTTKGFVFPVKADKTKKVYTDES